MSDQDILAAAASLDRVAAALRTLVGAPPPPPPPPPPDPTPVPTSGIWTSAAELARLSTSGKAWDALFAAAQSDTSAPNVANQDDGTDVRTMAKGLVYARTGEARYRDQVHATCLKAIGTEGNGRALALGRNLIGYVIAADLVGFRDPVFVSWVNAARRVTMTGGPASLIESHEKRPNNWGTHAGASRVAAAVYLGDKTELMRCAVVFRGWLGDRVAYSGFDYSAPMDWHADAARPVGINPAGASRDGHSIDGVLPDDQRRSGGFAWPPPKQNYVYEALQGAIAQAVILERAGYLDVWRWQDKALLRAYTWLHEQAKFPAAGDDTWQMHIVNQVYGTSFPAPVPSNPGKNCGFSDYTHQ